MIVAAKSHQDKLAWGQHTNTFTLNNVVPSTINLTAFNITHVRYPRDSTSQQSASTAIVNALASFGSLLLVAALAYYLWKVRQGRIHHERISLAHFVPRRRRVQQPLARVTDTQIERRVSTDVYNPVTALPWSLLRDFRPTPALTAPVLATLPLPVVSRPSVDTPTVPERVYVTGSYPPQEPYRPVVPSLNLSPRSNSSSPILHTPPPSWESLSPRPPTYDFEDAITSSSSGH